MSVGRSRRVCGNDWSVLDAPSLGSWEPQKSVTVVIPAYRADRTLPYTLAALGAQTYPNHLLEVVVVDDGAHPPLQLPEVRPDNTRLLRAESSWGRANACREGAEAADGDVIHWLDADMVPCRDQVEAQMRWHHEIDYAVVLGQKTFVDADGLPAVADVLDAVEHDTVAELFSGRWTDDHIWVEEIWCATDDLQRSGFRAFHVHVGATASVGRELYRSSGGMDPALKLGEDIELGYRLTMKGGVFVADRQARSWHLGRSTLMRHEQQVQRYNVPFIADRVPDFRKMRQERGRMYRVPFVEVVVRVEGYAYEQVKYTVDGILQAVPGDVRCVLLGRWCELHEERRHPLEDALLDMRLIHEEYASEARVTFGEELEPTAFPALFRLHMPVGWRTGRTTLDAMTRDMQQRALGLRSVLLPDGQVARLERTAAFERALRLREEGEDIDDVVDDVSATWWSEGVEDGFVHPELAPAPRKRPADKPANGQLVPQVSGSAHRPSRERLRATADRVGLGRIRSAVRRSSPE